MTDNKQDILKQKLTEDERAMLTGIYEYYEDDTYKIGDGAPSSWNKTEHSIGEFEKRAVVGNHETAILLEQSGLITIEGDGFCLVPGILKENLLPLIIGEKEPLRIAFELFANGSSWYDVFKLSGAPTSVFTLISDGSRVPLDTVFYLLEMRPPIVEAVRERLDAEEKIGDFQELAEAERKIEREKEEG